MLTALASDERFLVTAMVRGTDTLLATATIGNCVYRREDVLLDHEFVDMLTNQDEVLHLDMALLHDTRPIAASA